MFTSFSLTRSLLCAYRMCACVCFCVCVCTFVIYRHRPTKYIYKKKQIEEEKKAATTVRALIFTFTLAIIVYALIYTFFCWYFLFFFLLSWLFGLLVCWFALCLLVKTTTTTIIIIIIVIVIMILRHIAMCVGSTFPFSINRFVCLAKWLTMIYAQSPACACWCRLMRAHPRSLPLIEVKWTTNSITLMLLSRFFPAPPPTLGRTVLSSGSSLLECVWIGACACWIWGFNTRLIKTPGIKIASGIWRKLSLVCPSLRG